MPIVEEASPGRDQAASPRRRRRMQWLLLILLPLLLLLSVFLIPMVSPIECEVGSYIIQAEFHSSGLAGYSNRLRWDDTELLIPVMRLKGLRKTYPLRGPVRFRSLTWFGMMYRVTTFRHKP